MSEDRSLTGNILLEAGTNELEVLIFRLGDRHYGVNVAKVREVIKRLPARDVPGKHPSVIGVFQLRGEVLSLIDLRRHLEIAPASDETSAPEQERGTIIVTEFNGNRMGFLVDAVDRIHRVSWSHILPIPPVHFGKAADGSCEVSSTTGAIDIDGRLMLMIDFESVADSILMEKRLTVSVAENELGVDRASKRVVVAEDSPFMRNQIRRALVASGYTGAEIYSDGQAAWDALNISGVAPDAIVSDIEMPRMDGLHLTKRIKDDPRFAHVPVVLFSSLVSKDNENKGRQVGATVQIPKPGLLDMVRLVDRVVSGAVIDGSTVAVAVAA